MKSLYEADDIHIVSYTVEDELVRQRLPREVAQTLYRKMRTKGFTVDIKKEVIGIKEPYINGFEVEM